VEIARIGSRTGEQQTQADPGYIKAHKFAPRLQAGIVWVNTYNNYDPAASFGGHEKSGYGRESGAAALEHYTQLKSVWMNLA
jgi:acyl-CoA reductase-like NAD-dependent aldehyde dehydrogenase